MKTEMETRMPQNCIFHEQNHREEVLEQLRYDSVNQPRSRLFSSTKGGTEGKRALGTRLTNKREFVFVCLFFFCLEMKFKKKVFWEMQKYSSSSF